MRSFLDPALFSSSCKASGQEAIHFPLAHTRLHLEPSHGHFAGGARDGRGTSPRQLITAFPEGLPAARAARRVNGSGEVPEKGPGAGRRAGIFCRPALMFLWLPSLLLREGLNGSGEH